MQNPRDLTKVIHLYLTRQRCTHRHVASQLIKITLLNTKYAEYLFWAQGCRSFDHFTERNGLLANSITVRRLSIVRYCT